MYIVTFEVYIKPSHYNDYLLHAQKLLSTLEVTEGFISVERFSSIAEKDKILSLSVWKDAESISVWRNNTMHRMSQASGKRAFFYDYRIMVARVERTYGITDRSSAPKDSINFHNN